MFCKDVKNWLIKHQPRPPEGNPLRRLITLSCLIAALTKAERASYKALGKEMDDNTDLESRIKKAKRWLTNKWTDIETHFIPYIKPIIRSIAKTGEIVIAIDGSTMGSGCMCLMISMIWRGRSIPICWVVRKAPKGHFPQEMHIEVTNVVNELFKVLVPRDCRIVFLGDGEFDGTDLQQACLDHGWDYVLKTAKDTLIADNPQMEQACRMDDMLPYQNTNHLFLPSMFVTKQGFGTVNIVYWHNRRYKKPLFLLTSLDYAPLAEQYYRKRFLIETLFGDLKSRGFNMERTKIGDPLTIFNLLIVASLSYILALLFEFTARRSPYLGLFCRKDQIDDLSVFQLGLQGLLFYIKQGYFFSFQFSKNFP